MAYEISNGGVCTLIRCIAFVERLETDLNPRWLRVSCVQVSGLLYVFHQVRRI